LGNNSDRGVNGAAVAGAAGAAVAGGAVGGLVGRNQESYGQLQNDASGSTYDLGSSAAQEKSARIKKEAANRKRKWWILVGLGVVIVLGIAGGVVGGFLMRNKSNSNSSNGTSSSGESASDDTAQNGDLDINSSEIVALLNNANLHKVFPGVDYTPVNTQYPDCLSNPPSQNNVTRDVAVLSQLTNTIRLYGTDCNQTEMTIHALKQLQMDDDIKIWLGVWQDNNKTTNARQLAQMWDILDTYGDTPFKGLIVANEILFREQMTVDELGDLLTSVRTNLTAKGMSLPVATSDLGDKWTSALAAVSDYVMANIHPFFAGTPAADAAAWTYNFWDVNNGPIFKTDTSMNVISETGWPTQGGTDCGTTGVTSCANGSVAGIDELNTFMADWVCQALANGTNYFWFEMFDEPWKISFDTESQAWEDHWGLMDVNRNLKSGVAIPDCGGKTVS
jgi:exo-beta-1,3-glucanase (GH17 family)